MLIAKSQFSKSLLYLSVLIISPLINFTLLDFKIEKIKDLFPAYVNLSKIIILLFGKLKKKLSVTCEPINPAPPVIKIFFNLFFICCIMI